MRKTTGKTRLTPSQEQRALGRALDKKMKEWKAKTGGKQKRRQRPLKTRCFVTEAPTTNYFVEVAREEADMVKLILLFQGCRITESDEPDICGIATLYIEHYRFSDMQEIQAALDAATAKPKRAVNTRRKAS